MTRETGYVISEVIDERLRQDKIWGEQNHAPAIWMAILGEEVGEANRAVIEADHAVIRNNGHDRWLDFIRQLRKELIQVAAVAVAAIESLDRNELKGE